MSEKVYGIKDNKCLVEVYPATSVYTKDQTCTVDQLESAIESLTQMFNLYIVASIGRRLSDNLSVGSGGTSIVPYTNTYSLSDAGKAFTANGDGSIRITTTGNYSITASLYVLAAGDGESRCSAQLLKNSTTLRSYTSGDIFDSVKISFTFTGTMSAGDIIKVQLTSTYNLIAVFANQSNDFAIRKVQ